MGKNLVVKLEIDRVDLVDEGANTESFIKIFKRKDDTMNFETIMEKLTEEEKAVVMAKVKPTPEPKPKPELSPEVEEMMKSLKEAKDEAEAKLEKINKQRIHEQAVTKAKELKALPAETDELVEIVKGASDSIYELLKKANKAIEESDAFKSIGDKRGKDIAPYDELDNKAKEISKAKSISYEKAFSEAMDELPEVYAKYKEEEVE